jgi:hypothetical protein
MNGARSYVHVSFWLSSSLGCGLLYLSTFSSPLKMQMLLTKSPKSGLERWVLVDLLLSSIHLPTRMASRSCWILLCDALVPGSWGRSECESRGRFSELHHNACLPRTISLFLGGEMYEAIAPHQRDD